MSLGSALVLVVELMVALVRGGATPATRSPTPEPPVRWSRFAHQIQPAPPDSFEHKQHQSLTCVTCHLSASRYAVLNFEVPRGCDICHHREVAAGDCSQCHTTAKLAPRLWARLSVTVQGTPTRIGPAAFDHETHRSRECRECHTTPVTMAPAAEARTCVSCHEDHHAAERNCSGCHVGQGLQAGHVRPAEPHAECDACHEPQTIARLTPTRSLCATCHEAQRTHYPDRECTACHFQSSPATFRQHLQRAG